MSISFDRVFIFDKDPSAFELTLLTFNLWPSGNFQPCCALHSDGGNQKGRFATARRCRCIVLKFPVETEHLLLITLLSVVFTFMFIANLSAPTQYLQSLKKKYPLHFPIEFKVFVLVYYLLCSQTVVLEIKLRLSITKGLHCVITFDTLYSIYCYISK